MNERETFSALTTHFYSSIISSPKQINKFPTDIQTQVYQKKSEKERWVGKISLIYFRIGIHHC